MVIRDSPLVIRRGIDELRRVPDSHSENQSSSEDSLNPHDMGFLRPGDLSSSQNEAENSSSWTTISESEDVDGGPPRPPGGSGGVAREFRERLNRTHGSFDPTTDALQQVQRGYNIIFCFD